MRGRDAKIGHQPPARQALQQKPSAVCCNQDSLRTGCVSQAETSPAGAQCLQCLPKVWCLLKYKVYSRGGVLANQRKGRWGLCDVCYIICKRAISLSTPGLHHTTEHSEDPGMCLRKSWCSWGVEKMGRVLSVLRAGVHWRLSTPLLNVENVCLEYLTSTQHQCFLSLSLCVWITAYSLRLDPPE